MATTKSTRDTANENFMTDHGSMRLRCRRARRGPRVAAPATVARAERRVSDTRAAPTDRLGVTTGLAPVGCRTPGGGAFTGGAATEARATTGPGGTAAVPVEEMRPVDVGVGLGRGVGLGVPAGTPTTGTLVRTVGSDSATG